MPTIATLGALSYDKVPLSTTANNWLISANAINFGDTIINKSALYIAGRSGISTGPNAAIYKISQDFTPVIAAQGTLSTTIQFSTITVDNSNNLMLGGKVSSTQGLILSIDENINVLSSFNYPGAISTLYRFITDILYDTSGNYYVAGITYQGATYGYVMFISKVNVSTNTIAWSKFAYQTGALVTTISSSVYPIKMKFDSSGNILVMYSQLGGGPSTTYYLKLLSFNTSGILNYQRRFTGGALNGAFEIDSSDNIYVLTSSGVLQKYNSSLTLQWAKQLQAGVNNLESYIDFNSDDPIEIYDNNLYVSLYYNQQAYLIKLDFNGNIIWGNELSYYIGVSQQTVGVRNFSLNNPSIFPVFNPVTSTCCVMNLPIDGTVPGSGNYTISGNTYVTYNSGNVTGPSTTAISDTVGNLTIVTANTASISSSTTGANNTITTYTVITL